jgi:hypothetical protein
VGKIAGSYVPTSRSGAGDFAHLRAVESCRP